MTLAPGKLTIALALVVVVAACSSSRDTAAGHGDDAGADAANPSYPPAPNACVEASEPVQACETCMELNCANEKRARDCKACPSSDCSGLSSGSGLGCAARGEFCQRLSESPPARTYEQCREEECAVTRDAGADADADAGPPACAQ
jgi:hypothetical protein